MRQSRVSLFALVLGVGMLAACGSSSPSGSGGTLTYIINAEVNTLDPAKTSSRGASGGAHPLYAIYDSLLVVNAETGEVEPRIAASFEPKRSARNWRLKIRKGVEFSDGTVLDAAAVKFNWERSKDPETEAVNAAAASEIASMKVIDPLTLEVRLVEPDVHFDYTVATRLPYIASPTAIREGGDEKFGRQPVGAGPFVLTEWVRESFKQFERNPNYYENSRPYVDNLRIEVVTDSTQLRNAMKSNQADMAYSLNLVDVEPLEEDGLGSVRVLTPGSPDLVFNTAEPPFDDVELRRAVALGIDREQMAENTKAFEHLAAPFPEDSSDNFGYAWPEFDPDKAQGLFDAYARTHGSPVQIKLSAFNDTTNRAMATYIQAALNEFDGVKVDVAFASATAGVSQVLSGEYQMSLWGSLYNNVPELKYHLKTNEQSNVMKYSNAAVDDALQTITVGGSPAQVEAASSLVVEHLVSDIPFLSLGARASTNVYQSHVSDVYAYDDGVPDFSQIRLDN